MYLFCFSRSGLSSPKGLAMNADFFFVANTGAGTIVKISRTSYSITTIVPYAKTTSGTWGPDGVAYDSITGNLYIADTLNGDVKQYTTGGVISVINPAEKFNRPSGIAVDSYGGIYVGDNNHLRAAISCAATGYTGSAGISYRQPVTLLPPPLSFIV